MQLLRLVEWEPSNAIWETTNAHDDEGDESAEKEEPSVGVDGAMSIMVKSDEAGSLLEDTC